MSSAAIVLNGATSGSATLVPTDNVTVTQTLSNVSNVVVAINGPAFSAYGSANQNFSSGVSTKVTLDIETFDTNNNFASSRFTPTVAGYYQINAVIRMSDTVALASGQVLIFKNGSQYNSGVSILSGLAITNMSILVYLNGTTDYIELYGYGTGTAPYFNFASVSACCSMSGFLARSA